jgi:type I restriction enzyme S subunit
MAIVTIGKIADMNRESRWAAEFWLPGYLAPLKHKRNWKPIGDVLTACQYGLSHDMNEDGIGVPCYRMNEMDGLFLTTPMKCMEVTGAEHNACRLRRGDVLFNRTNSLAFVGRTGYLAEDIDAIFASYLVRLVPDRSEVLPEYLAVYLNTPTGIGQVKRRAMESINQANVSASELCKVPIPVFPLDWQKPIASLVHSAAAQRHLSLKHIAAAESRLMGALGLDRVELSPQKCYTRRFSDLQAEARFDAEYFKPEYQRIIKTLRAGGRTIADVAPLAQRPFEATLHPKGSNFRYIEIGSLTGGGEAEVETLDVADAPSRAKWLVKPGDVITALVGAERRLSALVRHDQDGSVCSSGFATLTPKPGADGIEPEVLLTYLRVPIISEIIALHQTGTILSSVPVDRLMRIPIIVPDTKTRKAVVAKVQEAMTARAEASRLLEQAKKTVEDLIAGKP